MLWSSDEVCSTVAFISIFYKMAPQIVFLGSCVPVVSVGQESLLNLSLVNSSSFIFIPAVLSGVGWFVYSLSLGMWFPRYKRGSLCVSLVRIKTLTSHFNFLQSFLYKWLYVEFSSEFLYAICFLRDASSGEIIRGLMTV